MKTSIKEIKGLVKNSKPSKPIIQQIIFIVTNMMEVI